MTVGAVANYVSGELANSFARSERVDQVQKTARSGKRKTVRSAPVSVRDDREGRPSEVIDNLQIAGEAQ